MQMRYILILAKTQTHDLVRKKKKDSLAFDHLQQIYSKSGFLRIGIISLDAQFEAASDFWCNIWFCHQRVHNKTMSFSGEFMSGMVPDGCNSNIKAHHRL